MNILDKIQSKLKKIFSGNKNESNAPFVQWMHKNMTKSIATLVHQVIKEFLKIMTINRKLVQTIICFANVIMQM